MHKFLSLTRVTLKCSIGMIHDGRSKGSSTAIMYTILFICMVPVAGLIYMMFHSMFSFMDIIDQSGSVLALAMYVASFITFFFSLFLIPSIFYFSKDGEILLALPLKAETILGSKLIVCLLYEYAFTLFVMIPSLAAYIVVHGISMMGFLFSIIIVVLLPIYPLILSTLISMFIMRFVPFFKNRDRFNLIAGFFSLAFGLGLSMFSGNLQPTQNPEVLIQEMLLGDNSLIRFMGNLFPGVPRAAYAMIDGNIVEMLCFMGITIIAIILCLLVGKKLYFSGLIGFSETSTSRKKLSDKDVASFSHQRNRIMTYTWKEIKLIIRTPIYAMNCIGSAIILPILLFIMPMIGGRTNGMSEIPIELMNQLLSLWPYVLISGIVLGFFISNLNLISSTSISREGNHIAFMKYIPMPLAHQLQAKAFSGIIVSILTTLLMMISIFALVPTIPIWTLFVVFIFSIPSIVLGNYIGIYIDTYHAKLVWEQESAAVKQNINSVIAMMVGIVFAIIICILAFVLPKIIMPYIAIGILLFIIVLIVVLYKQLDRFADKAFKNYY